MLRLIKGWYADIVWIMALQEIAESGYLGSCWIKGRLGQYHFKVVRGMAVSREYAELFERMEPFIDYGKNSGVALQNISL